MDDREVVGNTLSTACYLPESFVALHFGNTTMIFPWQFLPTQSGWGQLPPRSRSWIHCCHADGNPRNLAKLRMMEKLRCDIQALPITSLKKSHLNFRIFCFFLPTAVDRLEPCFFKHHQ